MRNTLPAPAGETRRWRAPPPARALRHATTPGNAPIGLTRGYPIVGRLHVNRTRSADG